MIGKDEMIRSSINGAVDEFFESITNNVSDMQEKHHLQRELLYKDKEGHSAIDHHKKFGEKKQRKPSGFLKKLVLAAAASRNNSVHPDNDEDKLVEEPPLGEKGDGLDNVTTEPIHEEDLNNSQSTIEIIEDEVEDLKEEHLDEMPVVTNDSLA